MSCLALSQRRVAQESAVLCDFVKMRFVQCSVDLYVNGSADQSSQILNSKLWAAFDRTPKQLAAAIPIRPHVERLSAVSAQVCA